MAIDELGRLASHEWVAQQHVEEVAARRVFGREAALAGVHAALGVVHVPRPIHILQVQCLIGVPGPRP